MNPTITPVSFEVSQTISQMERSHSCDICGKGFTRYDNLERHKLSHCIDKPFQCDLCNKSFSQKSHLKQHKVIHTGVKPFKCQLCGSAFSQNGNLTRHMKTHGVIASIGAQSNEQPNQVYENSPSQIYTTEKPFKCNVCGADFSRNGDLTRHFRSHEQSLLPQGTTDYAPNYSGEPERAAEEEENEEIGVTDDNTSPNKYSSLPVTSYGNNNDNPFNCKACWKAFTECSDAGLHERIHAALLPFRCDVCGKAFAENSYLIRHKRSHTREKLFTCDVCTKSFGQKSHLKVHHRIHTGERPFRCGLCGYAFARKDHLERHLRNNKNGAKLSCIPRHQHNMAGTTVIAVVSPQQATSDDPQGGSSEVGAVIDVAQAQQEEHDVQAETTHVESDVPQYMNI